MARVQAAIASTITMSRIRADRIATLYFFGPLHRLVGEGSANRVPILMYHSISDGEAGGKHPYFETRTSPRVFDEHVKYLRDNNYSVISPEEVVANVAEQNIEHRKCVAITFDDGFRDFYTNAFPILSKYGFIATMYLPTAYIQQKAQNFKGIDCLSWSEVRELQRAGMQFGSHTVTHPVLKQISHAQVESELVQSKQTIEQELGIGVTSFAYPYAFPEEDREFTQRLRGALESSGYQNGVSTVIGSTHSPDEKFFLKRIPANSWDDLALFHAKLAGDYDWLRGPQYLRKWAKKLAGGAIASSATARN
jgi:peptidoglycan/xylan/chitin deacetylase (PgdA/CDA1 family)